MGRRRALFVREGGIGRAVGHQTASSGMAFATTWALGQLAKQYYGGGRTLDAGKLKAAFAPLRAGSGPDRSVRRRIADRARTIDVRIIAIPIPERPRKRRVRQESAKVAAAASVRG